MILRIIALTMVLSLTLSTSSLANQKSSSNLSTLKWERSVKTRMFLGIAIGLIAAGVAVVISKGEVSSKAEEKAKDGTTSLIATIGVIGFGYAFWNWRKLNPPSGTGFTYTSPGAYTPPPQIYIPLPQRTRVKCGRCRGTGLRKCFSCRGRGGRYTGEGIFRRWWDCFRCNGTGLGTCRSCGGSGEY